MTADPNNTEAKLLLHEVEYLEPDLQLSAFRGSGHHSRQFDAARVITAGAGEHQLESDRGSDRERLGRIDGGTAHADIAGRDLKDPLISPIYGDLSGLPPTILVTGSRDLFLSATCRTHRKLRAAGVPAELHVYEGMSHADYLTAASTPEG